MVNFNVSVLSTIAIFASAVLAAPSFDKRQLGGLQCNLNRLQIVGALGDAQDSVAAMQAAAVPGSPQAALAADAQAGIEGANGGIQAIAGGLLSGQEAAQADRDAVATGLTGAITAVEQVQAQSDGTNPQLDTAATAAQDNLAKAAKAGQGVVANCA